jgi:endonuclease/exonuclease/phosphatase (EEP) superfamily protein YafD
MSSSPRVLAWSGRHARDLDAQSDQRTGIMPGKPSIHSYRPSALNDDQMASRRPSLRRRAFRTLARFSIAVLIGIGATLGWQSYGDEAKELVVTRAPSLGWLLPASKTESPVASATSADVAQQLAPLAMNLDVVRRGVEKLAAKQEQMAQNITALQAAEEEIRQKLSAPPPPQQEAAVPQHKPPQPRAASSAVQSSSAPSPRSPAAQPLRSIDSPAQPAR